MRFYDLKNLSDEEARSLIAKCQKIKVKEVLDNPDILSKKILIFRGNYDGFATNKLCVRTFEYIPAEQRWKVSDIIVNEMFKISFDKHFKKEELQEQFKAFCNAEGFVMDV